MSDDLKSLTIEEVIVLAELDQTKPAELLAAVQQLRSIMETTELHEEAMTALAERYAKMCSALRCTRGDIKLVWCVVDYLDLAIKWALDSIEANQSVTGDMTPDGTLM